LEQLPIDDHLNRISELMAKHQNLVIKASPGSGKTTRIPPFLNQHFKKILVLEPRRIAAISASDRIAKEQNWELGQKIGYHVRFDKNYSSKSEIVFLTEALLARKLLHEESLKEIELVILDEFHERSLWTDLCLGIIKEWQDLGSNLKLMILSATLDQVKIQNYLHDCQIYQVEIPKFPLETIYNKIPFKNIFDNSIINKIIEALKDATAKKRNHILIFLPGVGEINKTKTELLNQKFLADYTIETLHGNIPLNDQRRIIQNKTAAKSIILSTNLAESSVTINNLDTVIDTGMIKISDYNIKTSVQQLNLRKISLASAEQRQGRSNRQAPGIVYKLWTLLDEKSMDDYNPPEIVRADLSLPFLFLTHLGIKSDHYFKDFSWFETPSEESLKLTTDELLSKKLIINNKLTRLGQILLNLNLDYHLGLIIILGQYFNILREACLLVALLQEKDIINTPTRDQSNTNNENYFSDLLLRLELYLNNPKPHPQIGELAKSFQDNFQRSMEDSLDNLLENMDLNIREEFVRIKNEPKDIFALCQFVIDYVFIDKLCKRRKDNKTKDVLFLNTAVNQFGTEIGIYEHNFKSLFFTKKEFFLSLKSFLTPQKDLLSSWVHFISTDRVYLFLNKELTTDYAFSFNSETKKISKTKNTKYRNMTLKSIEGLEITADDKNKIFKSIILEDFNSYKTKISSLNLFFNRLNFLLKNQVLPQPIDIDWETIVTETCDGESNLDSIINKDWAPFIQQNLPQSVNRIFTEEAPLSWSEAKNKRSFSISYEQEDAQIESKLQHFFGIKKHPTIGKSAYKLKIVLLGPNGRPIQITKDLIGFWKSSYPEIRKELRGRYPKHAWPEDPCAESLS
jgi:ATP-dependent helicase HrpB